MKGNCSEDFGNQFIAFQRDLLAYEQKLFGPCWPRFRFPPPHPVMLSLYTHADIQASEARDGEEQGMPIWCSSWFSWTQHLVRLVQAPVLSAEAEILLVGAP